MRGLPRKAPDSVTHDMTCNWNVLKRLAPFNNSQFPQGPMFFRKERLIRQQLLKTLDLPHVVSKDFHLKMSDGSVKPFKFTFFRPDALPIHRMLADMIVAALPRRTEEEHGGPSDYLYFGEIKVYYAANTRLHPACFYQLILQSALLDNTTLVTGKKFNFMDFWLGNISKSSILFERIQSYFLLASFFHNSFEKSFDFAKLPQDIQTIISSDDKINHLIILTGDFDGYRLDSQKNESLNLVKRPFDKKLKVDLVTESTDALYLMNLSGGRLTLSVSGNASIFSQKKMGKAHDIYRQPRRINSDLIQWANGNLLTLIDSEQPEIRSRPSTIHRPKNNPVYEFFQVPYYYEINEQDLKDTQKEIQSYCQIDKKLKSQHHYAKWDIDINNRFEGEKKTENITGEILVVCRPLTISVTKRTSLDNTLLVSNSPVTVDGLVSRNSVIIAPNVHSSQRNTILDSIVWPGDTSGDFILQKYANNRTRISKDPNGLLGVNKLFIRTYSVDGIFELPQRLIPPIQFDTPKK